MARTQARLLTSVWTDADWLALSAGAQRLYMVLLSQPKLSLAGCLDVMPARWASTAPDETEESVRANLAELAAGWFVVVDDETGELVIRTFVRADIGPKANSNLVKGMWGAWEAILSPKLRKIVVDNMPAEVFDRCPDEVPDLARRMRSEPPIERPSERAFERPLERSPEPPVPCPLLPATTSAASLRTTPEAEPDQAPAGPPTALVNETVGRVSRKLAEAQAHTNPAGLAATIGREFADGKRPVELDRIRMRLASGQSPKDIAAEWSTDQLDGLLYPSADRSVPERHGPRMEEYRRSETAWQAPSNVTDLIAGSRKNLANGGAA